MRRYITTRSGGSKAVQAFKKTMLIDTLVTGPFQENCFLVAEGEGEECVLIDPGDEADRIAARVEELGLTPVMILNTHGHLDHIGAVPD